MTPSGPASPVIGAAIIELEPGALVELRRFGRWRELVDEVAEGEDHAVLGHGRPGRPDPDVDPELRPLLVGEEVADAAIERPVEVARRRVEEVEDDAVGADQADGLVDDVAEDLGRVAQHGDPGGDLAQRLLRLGRGGRGPRAIRRARR